MKVHGELREANLLAVLDHLKKIFWISWLRCGLHQVPGLGHPSQVPNIVQQAAVSRCQRWSVTLSETWTSMFARYEPAYFFKCTLVDTPFTIIYLIIFFTHPHARWTHNTEVSKYLQKGAEN